MLSHIRRLEERDAAAWRRLRLEALEGEPFPFEKSAEEHLATAVATIALRFRNPREDDFTLGAFENGNLVGGADPLTWA